MRIQSILLAILLAAAAFGQQAAPENIERTLQFARATATQDFQEMVAMIRTMSEIREAAGDPIQRTLKLRAPADQIGIADWLFSKLDTPSGSLPAGVHEYRIAGSRDNILRLHHVANAATVQDFQEIATLIRTISDIRYAYTYNAPRILGLRSSAGQIAMAEWLFQEIDQPLTAARVAHEYFVSDSSNDVMRVFYMPLTTTVKDFQETATVIRTATGIRRMYTYNTARAMAARGTIEQIAQAARLLQEKGQAQVAQGDFSPNGGDDVIGTFQLPLNLTDGELLEAAGALREGLESRRIYSSTARVIIVRGTSEQVAQAGRMLQEKGLSQTPPGEFVPDSRDSITRIFQVPPTATLEEFQETTGAIRSSVELSRLYTYPAARIVMARGAPGQVERAARMLHEKGWQ